MRCFHVFLGFFSSDFIFISMQFKWVLNTHNICLYKEEDKKYIGSNLKTTELLNCALIGVCGVIRLNTVW